MKAKTKEVKTEKISIMKTCIINKFKFYLSLRKKVSYTFSLSLVSIVLSVTAVIRCEPMKLDAVVLLASIISIPVAVFAITQALNYLWYENKIKSGLDDLSRELRRDFRIMENDMQIAIRSYHLMISEREHIVCGFEGHIQGALSAIIEDSKSQNHLSANDIIEQLYLYMKKVNQSTFYIDASRKIDYIKALSQINDDRIPEICNFIFSCKGTKDPEEDKKSLEEEKGIKEDESRESEKNTQSN